MTPTIIFVRVSMRLSFDDEESFKEAAGSLRFNNSSSDPNSLAHQRVGSSSSTPPQERNEDICLNNPQLESDSNTLRRLGVGISSSTPPQERSKGY